jgi:HEAT repeat protein
VTVDLEAASIDELITLARASEEPDAYWATVAQLQRRGGERAFELAGVLCDSILAGERCLGADVLGRLDGFTEESRPVVRNLLDDDQPAVLAAAAASVGFLNDREGVDQLVVLASHPEEGVRFAVLSALMRIDVDRSVAMLTELSIDGRGDVREWATDALQKLGGV